MSNLNNRPHLSTLILFCLMLFVCSAYSKQDGNIGPSCEDTNCSDYTSQQEAQLAFEADPECRADLDADNDGIACEENGNSVTICPSTANCGCSGLNKAQCPTNVCCRWVVGEGCKCK